MEFKLESGNKISGVYKLDGHLATCNLNPGVRVYREKLVDYEDKEYRLWDPRRSKLAAAFLKGLEVFPVKNDSRVLYLGASAGTTPPISRISSPAELYTVWSLHPA